MPKYQCPFPDCTYETEDVADSLAAVLISVHSSGTHTANATSTSGNGAAKIERVRRPTISTAGSSEDWSYFHTRWQDYIDATKITGKEKVVQLLECCDEQLRKDLTRNTGGSLTNKPIEDVMSAIRKLAVREESTMVARVQLHNMHQDRDETVRSFGARLRGQAGVCKFTTQCLECNASVNYTEHILRDVLTRGLSDSEIQLDLLGDKNQDMTLEEVLQFVEAKESGKRSAGRLLQTQGAEAARSQYRSTKQMELKNRRPDNHKPDPCHYCGKHGHGNNSPIRIRKSECTAYGKTCDHCGRANHFAAVCQAKSQPGKRPSNFTSPSNLVTEGAIFDTLCTVTNSSQDQSVGTITLDHHLYNHLNDCWVRKTSQPQPFLTLTASIYPDDYTALGFKPISQQPQSIQLSAMEDTGCQSCLTSMTVVRRLGLSKKDLIPVSTRMHAANNNGIEILGAIILRFSGKSKSNQIRETRQIVYVTDYSDKLFLSRETCTALGLIPGNFPTVGETPQPSNSSDAAGQTHQPTQLNIPESAQHPPCDCPRRVTPPPKPTQPPFPTIVANRQRLQQLLLDYYKSSTFNTCEHQLLPLMDAVPMRLMVDPDAEPVAHHTPVPVPLHWQADVKAGLDHDISLGVLEPVPVGEPVTWCHRMVVCAKKNGKPRRTVDFQALNRHATHETHHTQSPFHQARTVPNNKKKTVTDCWNGYHSIPLHKDDYHLTTFITPWGRYRYKTAPQGYIASGDGYSRRFDEIVSHVPNKTKCVDDTLLWADNLSESFTQAIDWLDLCGHHGITLNPDKFVFGADTVEFAGFEITPDSVRPCKKYLDAIRNFPTPANITDMRSWFGLINQVSYAFAATNRMLPFRQSLKPGESFNWNNTLNQLFEESKAAIVSEIEEGVRIFDKSKPTCLATDWSKNGIGYWLFQKHCQCASTEPFCCPTGWKVALVGSRFTHAAESRYAPVEGEALAVTDALDKARFFVLGCSNLIIAVDHKPLLKIFGDRSLEDISNGRLRNLKEKTLRYRFRMIHIPGVQHKAADAVSRHPTGSTNPDLLKLTDDIAAIDLTLHSIMAGTRCNEPQLESCSHEIDNQLTSSAVSALSTLAITWTELN
ncbi:hypothetical protein QZH41_004849 [Actinostola sp. cb2023]|nr:hypothetical protein QZH41_004849 [Actinostola sp. cb2023]